MGTDTREFQIGTVKWFGNTRTKAEYGFVTDLAGNDLFFHQRSILASHFTPAENDIVVFESFPSARREGQFEAGRVRPLGEVSDVQFLMRIYMHIESEGMGHSVALAVARRLGAIVSDVSTQVALTRRVATVKDTTHMRAGNAADKDLPRAAAFASAAFGGASNQILSQVFADAPLSVRYRLWRRNLLDWFEDFIELFCIDWRKQSQDDSEEGSLHSTDLKYLLCKAIPLDGCGSHPEHPALV